MRTNRIIGLAGIAFATVLAGCDLSDGGSETFRTDIWSGQRVQNLPPDQSNQLCGDVDAYLMGQLEAPAFCEAAAVVSTAKLAAQDPNITDDELQQLCAIAIRRICPVSNGACGAAADDAPSCDWTDGCAATVAQVSRCVDDIGATFAAFAGTFPSCATVTRARLAGVDQNAAPPEPASCFSLGTSCPGFDPMVSASISETGGF